MNELRHQFVEGWGDARLAVHRMGEGRPVLLLHGLFSSAEVNWIKFGHAARLAEAGFEAIMPDLRAHGQSDAPHEPEAYPADVLVKDVLAVIDALALDQFDLGGFSLGSRTAVRAVLAGLAPRRLVLGGMGLEGLDQWDRRSAFFIEAIDNFETIKRGDPHYLAQQFMKTMKVDRTAARLLLGSVDGTDVEDLRRVIMPTLVVCGADDDDNGSAPALAQALPDAAYAEVPGTHMSSVTRAEFGEAIVGFLSA
jgi:pimeloyl-ACP methyl ester carboxylesterase